MPNVVVKPGTITAKVGLNNDQIVKVTPKQKNVVVATGPSQERVVVGQTENQFVRPASDGPRVIEVGTPGPAGPPGPAGGEATVRIAGHTMGGHRLVRLQADATVAYVDNTSDLHGDDTYGVTIDAALAGGGVTVQTFGEIVEPSWAWLPGEPIFASTNGLLTQTAPDLDPARGPVFSQVVGFAATPTSMVVSIQPAVYN